MNKCVAHRGWSGKAPENTMAAFTLALEEPEIYAIELDVHLSKDGIPIVIHDHSLERTSDGTGLVMERTAEELQKLDAGKWFGMQYEGEKIPLLEEVLKTTKNKKPLLIELKQMGNYYQRLEQKVVSLVNQYGMQSQVTIISFDHQAMKKVKEIDSNMKTGLIFSGNPTMLYEQLDFTGAQHASMNHHFLTEELVKYVKNRGIELGAWTVNDRDSLVRTQALSEQIIITTNYPELMLRQSASTEHKSMAEW